MLKTSLTLTLWPNSCFARQSSKWASERKVSCLSVTVASSRRCSFPALAIQKNIEVDLALITYYDKLLNDLELYILKTAKQHDAHTLYLLQTVPGIGKILSLVLLYETYDINRFPRVQDFASYCRLVKCAKESAGKRLGTSGKKIGNAHLKWAFSEAATLFLRSNEPAQKYLVRLEKKHDKGKALTILAHKLARAVYYMLKRKTVFDMDIFLHTSGSRAGEPGASLDTQGMSLHGARLMPVCLRL